jgi:hypothetical protein
VLEQRERDSPGVAVAVNRCRALVDAHDLSDVSLQILVCEADALSHAEVLFAVDLGLGFSDAEFACEL